MRISAQMTGKIIDFGASLSCGFVRHYEGTECGKELLDGEFVTRYSTASPVH